MKVSSCFHAFNSGWISCFSGVRRMQVQINKVSVAASCLALPSTHTGNTSCSKHLWHNHPTVHTGLQNAGDSDHFLFCMSQVLTTGPCNYDSPPNTINIKLSCKWFFFSPSGSLGDIIKTCPHLQSEPHITKCIIHITIHPPPTDPLPPLPWSSHQTWPSSSEFFNPNLWRSLCER